MKLHKFIAVLVLLYVSHGAYADSLNIQLSDASARLIYAAEVFGGEFGPTDMEVGAYFNDVDDTVAHVSLVLKTDSIENPFVAAIGGRFYYGDVGNAVGQTPATVAAITFGVSLSFKPERLVGVGFSAYYFASPSVTSYLDAERFAEYGLTMDIVITEQVGFYVGYRNMSADLDTGANLEIDDSFMYGFVFRF